MIKGFRDFSLLGEEGAEIGVGFAVVGTDSQGFAEAGFGQIEFLAPDVGDSEVVVGPGIFRKRFNE